MMRQQYFLSIKLFTANTDLVVDVKLGTRKSSQLWKLVKEDVEILTLLYLSYKRFNKVN